MQDTATGPFIPNSRAWPKAVAGGSADGPREAGGG